MCTEKVTTFGVHIPRAHDVARVLLGGLCLALFSSPAWAQDPERMQAFFRVPVEVKATLEQLTVPADLLPDGCELAPQGGLPMGAPMDRNPVIAADSLAIKIVSGFVLGIPADIEPTVEAFEEWRRGLLPRIEAAYTAMYFDADHQEVGVLALLFKEPIDPQAIGRSMMTDPPIVKESIVIASWADGEDRSCYDAVRRYLENVSIR